MTTQTKPHDRLTDAERHELPDSAFGIPETREFPLVDAEHVRAAEAYFRYAPDTEKAALMLSDAQAYLQIAPWAAIFPGLMIVVIILGFSMISEGLRVHQTR